MTTTNFLDKTGLEYYTNKLDERFLSSSSAAKRIVELSEIVSTDTDGTEYIDPRYLLADNYYVADKNYTARLIKTSGVVNESFNGSGNTPSISTYDTFNIYEGDKLIGNASRDYSIFSAGTAFRVTSATRDLLLKSTSTSQNLNSGSDPTSGFIGLNLTTYSYTWTTKDLLADGITSYNDLTDKLVAGDNIIISDDNTISATGTIITLTDTNTNVMNLSDGIYQQDSANNTCSYIPLSSSFDITKVGTDEDIGKYIQIKGRGTFILQSIVNSSNITVKYLTLIPNVAGISLYTYDEEFEEYNTTALKTIMWFVGNSSTNYFTQRDDPYFLAENYDVNHITASTDTKPVYAMSKKINIAEVDMSIRMYNPNTSTETNITIPKGSLLFCSKDGRALATGNAKGYIQCSNGDFYILTGASSSSYFGYKYGEENIKIINLDTATAPINALDLETGTYKIKPSSDTTNRKSLYFPYATNATISTTPGSSLNGFYYGAAYQIVATGDNCIIDIIKTYYDSDGNETEDKTTATSSTSDVYIDGDSFVLYNIKRNRITDITYTSYGKLDWLNLSTWDENYDILTYYGTYKDSKIATEDYVKNAIANIGPQEAKINYITTKSNPPGTFSGYINITKIDTTWQPLSLDGVSNPGDFIIPKDTLLLGQGAKAISSQPMIAHFSDGRIYEIWCTSANLGMITTLYTPSSGGSDVSISTTEPTGDEVIWINPDEEYASSSNSEVVDSLSGDQHDMAPSVAAVKNLHTYSTDEQVIGTWIDGKPIYRKLVNITLEGVATTQEINFNQNQDKIIKLYGVIWNESNNMRPLPMVDSASSNVIRLSYTGGKLQVITNAGWGGYYGYLMIEYTKTTD